jgi:hypothetical protein
MYLSFEATQAIQGDRQRRFEAEAASHRLPRPSRRRDVVRGARPVRLALWRPAPAA